jgi:DMSO/TMAO reductase YedYZ molybdopterin-dependent catalytic subunit
VVEAQQLLGVGVSTRSLTDLVKVLPAAKFVLIHAEKGFTTNLSVSDFFEPDVLFALKHNGELLTPGHGQPVRLVVPRLYFWKSAKWVTGVEFMAEDVRGFWESHGYHNRGDPWLEERYSY